MNTENGLWIDSPELAEELARQLRDMMSPDSAWQVGLDDEGKLQWTSAEGTVSKQPAREESQRIVDWIFRLMPIESQL